MSFKGERACEGFPCHGGHCFRARYIKDWIEDGGLAKAPISQIVAIEKKMLFEGKCRDPLQLHTALVNLRLERSVEEMLIMQKHLQAQFEQFQIQVRDGDVSIDDIEKITAVYRQRIEDITKVLESRGNTNAGK